MWDGLNRRIEIQKITVAACQLQVIEQIPKMDDDQGMNFPAPVNLSHG